MRVGVLRETGSPEINGVAATVAMLARRLADAGNGVRSIRPRQHYDGRVAGSSRGIELPQARSAT